MAAPNDIREAALATIHECIDKERRGGYSTHNFKVVTDWITAPTTNFPGNLSFGSGLTYGHDAEL